MLVLFIGLGVWQLQRRVEKHVLIAALTERLAEIPEALPPSAQWSALTPAARRIPPRPFDRNLCAAAGCDGL